MARPSNRLSTERLREWAKTGAEAALNDSGYLRDQTIAAGSLWEGLAGLLVSPGRSLFLYSPVLLLALPALISLARRDARTAVLFAGECLVLLFFYASLVYWDADRSYGPRYLLRRSRCSCCRSPSGLSRPPEQADTSC